MAMNGDALDLRRAAELAGRMKPPGSGITVPIGGKAVPVEVAQFMALDQILRELKTLNARLEADGAPAPS